jgi:hypothetical protein
LKDKMLWSAKKLHPSAFWLKVFALGVLVMMVASLSQAVEASDAAGLRLPTRPVVETSTPESGSGPTKPVGGWIQLQVPGATDPNEWSDVQWQDSLGVWHPVESWQGQFDQVMNGVGTKTWWVDQYTFGPTPFRWVLFDGTGKTVLVTSEPFNLPTQNQQWVVVVVSFPSK